MAQNMQSDSTGKNLLGEMAYSASLPIAGTSWFFLTEVSKDEVMTDLYQLLVWTGVAALVALGIISSVLTLLWKQQKTAYQLALTLKDVELNKLMEKFHTTPFIGTGNLNGTTRKWISANPRLCEILGYSQTELVRRHYAELSPPEEMVLDEAYDVRLKSGKINHYTREKRFIQAAR